MAIYGPTVRQLVGFELPLPGAKCRCMKEGFVYTVSANRTYACSPVTWTRVCKYMLHVLVCFFLGKRIPKLYAKRTHSRTHDTFSCFFQHQ